MKEQIKAIREKYGEPILRMAIDHVIGVGINNLKNVNADEVCAQILKETPANAIMTPEFSAELMRCAIELSRVSIGDILKYIQTDMQYDGVTVHPGIIIRFMQNATCHNIMTCVIPADTNEEMLEDAVKTVEDRLEAYIDKTGSAYAFSFTTAIENAFKDASIEIKDLPVDKTFYL